MVFYNTIQYSQFGDLIFETESLPKLIKTFRDPDHKSGSRSWEPLVHAEWGCELILRFLFQ